MPKPFDWQDDEEMREDLVGCLMVLLGTLALAAGFVILYIVTHKLP